MSTQTPTKALCTGHKRDGSPCKLYPVHGATVCHKHGGSAPQVRAKAAQRLAEAKARTSLARANIAYPAHVEPAQALLGQVCEAAGNVEWLRRLLEEHEAPTTNKVITTEHATIEEPVIDPLWTVYGQERDRLMRASKMAVDAGVAQRAVAVAEGQAAAIVTVCLAVVQHFGLPVEPARAFVADQLRALSPGGSV